MPTFSRLIYVPPDCVVWPSILQALLQTPAVMSRSYDGTAMGWNDAKRFVFPSCLSRIYVGVMRAATPRLNAAVWI
jgi:hypothetical protein